MPTEVAPGEREAHTVLKPLRVEGVGYAYTRERRALDGVSFAVPAGSFTALLGPNGAGKTTLLAVVTRLFASRQGRVTIGGHDLARAPGAALAQLGVVFQRPTLDLDLTVERNLAYAAALYGLDRARTLRRIEAVLERLNMAGQRRTPVRQLSGGQRRRVELARAMLHEPRLLVLDEPTVGLDIDSRRALVEHVHKLCNTGGLAALWATHLVDEIRPQDRVVVLARGQVVAQGAVEAVVDETGASDLADAYRRLTASGAPAGMAEPAASTRVQR